MDRKIRLVHWAVALLGLWEAGDIAALFVPGFGAVPPFVWNHIAVGIILMAVGAWAAITSQVRTARTLDLTALVAGAWLVVASFVVSNPAVNPGLWNDVAVGALVVILASTAGMRLRRLSKEAQGPPQ